MKYIVISIMFVLFLISNNTKTDNKEENFEKINQINESSYEKWNHFNLNDLDTTSRYGYMINKIVLKENTNYTMVMSKKFLGVNCFSELYRGESEVKFIDLASSYEFSKNVFPDYSKDLGYLEFKTISNQLRIMEIPGNFENGEIILFEGEYKDFFGFVPYKSKGNKKYEGKYIIDFDEKIDVFDVLKEVYCKDRKDVTVNQKSIRIIKDEYTGSDKIGDHTVLIEVNSLGDKQRYNMNLFVVDSVSPKINLKPELTIPYNSSKTVYDLILDLNITDNVDDIDEENIKLIKDEYSSSRKTGKVLIEFEVFDNSGNRTSSKINVNLVDTTSPYLIASNTIFLYSDEEPLTYLDMIKRFIIGDEIDGNDITYTVTHDEYNKTKIPGRYYIHLNLKDKSGNSKSFSIYVCVVESMGVYFINSKYILDISKSKKMTNDELIEWYKNKVANSSIYDLRITLNEYETRETKKGKYNIFLEYRINNVLYKDEFQIIVQGNNIKWTIILSVVSVGVVTAVFGGIYIYLKKKSKKIN